jgi:hypothetical protein
VISRSQSADFDGRRDMGAAGRLRALGSLKGASRHRSKQESRQVMVIRVRAYIRPIRASLTCILLAAALLVGCGGANGSESPPEPAVTGSIDEKGSDLFVLRGPAEVTDDRIEVRTEVAEWFNDRPKRNAGVAEAGQLVDNWREYGFENDPPNAAAAGEESDAEIELSQPEITDDGISFAYKSLRGEISSEDASMSLFIDSSEWETDMHVYVRGNPCRAQYENADISDPVVLTAPDEWSKEPIDSFSVEGNDDSTEFYLFNAASSNGSTKFKVQYTMTCWGPDTETNEYKGTFTLSGSVPDSQFEDNDFVCSVPWNLCDSPDPSGFHTTAKAYFHD